MKRSPIQRKTPLRSKPRHEPRVEREPRPMATFVHAKPLSRGVMAGAVSGKAVEKDNPLRSEAYRRLVAAMPCANCAKPAPSQAAHANAGKGMATKTDDRTCWPACPSCHRDFDQGGMSRENRRVLEALYGQRTRAAILAAGTWPKNLPRWNEE